MHDLNEFLHLHMEVHHVIQRVFSTALAEAEIEYKDINSNTAYVKFPVIDGRGLIEREDTYVVIWTTTPCSKFYINTIFCS